MSLRLFMFELQTYAYFNGSNKFFFFFCSQSLAIMFPLVGLYQWKYHFIDFQSNIGMLVVSSAVAGNVLCGYFNLQWPKLKRN